MTFVGILKADSHMMAEDVFNCNGRSVRKIQTAHASLPLLLYARPFDLKKYPSLSKPLGKNVKMFALNLHPSPRNPSLLALMAGNC